MREEYESKVMVLFSRKMLIFKLELQSLLANPKIKMNMVMVSIKQVLSLSITVDSVITAWSNLFKPPVRMLLLDHLLLLVANGHPTKNFSEFCSDTRRRCLVIPKKKRELVSLRGLRRLGWRGFRRKKTLLRRRGRS